MEIRSGSLELWTESFGTPEFFEHPASAFTIANHFRLKG